MDGGAWQATVHGAANRHSDLTFLVFLSFWGGHGLPASQISGLHASVSLSHSSALLTTDNSPHLSCYFHTRQFGVVLRGLNWNLGNLILVLLHNCGPWAVRLF